MDASTRRAVTDFERYYPARFSQSLQKNWGFLFCNRDNPLSYDSNHAVITRMPEDRQGMLTEIIGFYRSKGIAPMIYPAFLPDETKWLWPVLVSSGFTIEERRDICMQFLGGGEAAPISGLAIREEKKVSPALAALIRADEGGDWTVKALGCVAGGPYCHMFVGHADGQPVAMAVLQVGKRAVRVDDVLTHPDYRCRGYATALMHRAVSLYRDRYADRPLYLWTENPAAERIYRRVWFRKADIGAPNWTAWMKRS